MVNENVDPAPGAEATVMSPPCRSTILLQMARPIPVPSYSPLACSRWNILKIRSACRGSMPIPLSFTEKTQPDPPVRAPMWISGTDPGFWNFSPFPMRFWKTG